MNHPMQPIEKNPFHGRPRFLGNKIIQWLQESGRIDLNEIVRMHPLYFDIEDMEQFWQLLGYSLDGYEDLSFVRPETIRKARRKAKAIIP